MNNFIKHFMKNFIKKFIKCLQNHFSRNTYLYSKRQFSICQILSNAKKNLTDGFQNREVWLRNRRKRFSDNRICSKNLEKNSC